MDRKEVKTLAITAAKARLLAVEAVHRCASGHPGGSLSVLDVLTVLYFHTMRVDPQNPADPDRDRFVLSKGHCTPALYATLALRGYYAVEELELFRSIKGHMSGHPDMVNVKGVDMSTGSLGQGISAAVGMAIAGKLDGKDYRVYAALGDGEIEEGQVWEAAMAAAKYKLDNLCAVVDVNGLQIDGAVADVMSPYPIDEKMRAFGFNVICINGNDLDEIDAAFLAARNCKGKPTAIVMKTTKGKGVSYMENKAGWHGKAPNDEEYEIAMSELKAQLAELEAE